MQSYANKATLIAAIQTSYDKYRLEFDDIPDHLKNSRVSTVDRTPAENLAYQIGWLTALLQWESDEQAGKKAVVPAQGYNWRQLGALYQSFYVTYQDLTLPELIDLLNTRVSAVCSLVNNYSDMALFEPDQRQWATTNAHWPVWKWIHINTVAPFKTFRTKIRKWKKAAL